MTSPYRTRSYLTNGKVVPDGVLLPKGVAARLSAAGDERMSDCEMERLVEHHHGSLILSRFARAEEAYLRVERT